MTDKQRLRAWDEYQAAKESFAAHREIMRTYASIFGTLSGQLYSHMLVVTETDYLGVPTQKAFIRAVNEFQAAVARLRKACVDAKQFGWPVDEEDVKSVGGL